MIFHANSFQKTDLWGAEKIGKKLAVAGNQGVSGGDTGTGANRGKSESFEYILPPAEFTKLQKAGPPHFAAEAIVFQNGRVFKATGQTFIRVRFPQIRG